MSASPAKPAILVIDDEAQIRRLLRRNLEAAGYTVREADSGGAGLAETASRPPEAVILDLGLPDMSGVEVVRQLREWSKVPVLVVRSGRPKPTRWRRLTPGPTIT